MKFAFSLFLAIALPTIASAQSFTAVNRLTVVPLSNSAFEVIEGRGEGARGIWCAAADYVLSRSNGDGQRLFVKTPRGPAVSVTGRIGVTFTTDAASIGVAPKQSIVVSVRHAGQGLRVHHANQFCRDFLEEFDDLLFRRRG